MVVKVLKLFYKKEKQKSFNTGGIKTTQMKHFGKN